MKGGGQLFRRLGGESQVEIFSGGTWHFIHIDRSFMVSQYFSSTNYIRQYIIEDMIYFPPGSATLMRCKVSAGMCMRAIEMEECEGIKGGDCTDNTRRVKNVPVCTEELF